MEWIWSVVELECSGGVLEFSGCRGEDLEWSGLEWSVAEWNGGEFEWRLSGV